MVLGRPVKVFVQEIHLRIFESLSSRITDTSNTHVTNLESAHDYIKIAS